MLRIILGLAAGVVLAFCAILVMEIIGQSLFPLPAGPDPRNAQALAAAMAQMPVPAFVFIVLGWIVGAGLGGWVANLLARRRWPAIVIGGLVAAGSVANGLMFSQPLWVSVAGVAGPLAAAWLVAQVVGTPRPTVAA